MTPASNWMDFAVDDIDSAGIMLEANKFNNVCYFSHQAAEKSLKGYLEQNSINPPRVHDLITLLKLCNNIDPEFIKFMPQVRSLNQFYIPTRYPDAAAGSLPAGLPGRELAEKVLNYAKEIV